MENDRKIKLNDRDKQFLLFVGFTVVICSLLIFFYPPMQVADFGINKTDSVNIATLVNDYRSTLVQFFGSIKNIIEGLAILVGLILIYKEYLPIKMGQLSKRFTKAIELLGKNLMEKKLGGIYELENIAKESDDYYWSIMEILTAYVREYSSNDKQIKQDKISSDIQAIMNVIKRRKYSFNNGETDNIELQNTFLQQANLNGANLEGANFSQAILRGAEFEGANLKKAYFNMTNLIGVNFKGANLESANLYISSLESADLEGANLEGANLESANLEGAILIGAKNLTIDQLSKVQTLYKAELDKGLEEELRKKYPVLSEKPEDES